MTQTIGMIGLGIMGSAISANFLDAGYPVVGYDISRPACDKLEGKGGTIAVSPAEVAQAADIVLTSLPTTAALDAVVAGEGGLLNAAGRDIVVMECSTFPIADKQRAHDALVNAGIVLLDTPLSGTGAQAVHRDLAVYGSGDEAAWRRCVPAIPGFARAHYFVGEFGNGSKMKYVANHLVAIHNIAAAEAFVLGMKAGLDAQTIYDVISDSAGTSRMFEVRGPMMVENDYSGATMKVEVWQKDMSIIGAFAKAHNVPTPLFTTSADIYTAAMAQGHAAEDTAAVCAVLADMARLKR
jgi:3-hydroxyisobutyrate dehydrogenase-like beta-hydroxyacid dehydrogenase